MFIFSGLLSCYVNAITVCVETIVLYTAQTFFTFQVLFANKELVHVGKQLFH